MNRAFVRRVPDGFDSGDKPGRYEMAIPDTFNVDSGRAWGISMHALRRQSLSRLLERVIRVTLLFLIPLAALPHGLSDPWWQAAFVCVVFALGALWIAHGFLIGDWGIKGWTMLIPLLALCAYVALQTAPLRDGNGTVGIANGARQTISADPLGTYRFLFLLVALVTFGQLLFQFTSSRRRSYWLIYITIGVVAGSACFGLVRLILQHGPSGFSVFNLRPTEGYGQLFNRNYFASMLVMILGLTLGLVVAGGVLRKYLLLHLAIISLLATSVVLTNSRGGIFAMMVQVVLLGGLFVMRRLQWAAKERARNSMLRRVGRLALGVLFIGCLVIAMSMWITKLGGERLERRLEKLSTEVDDNAVDPTQRRAEVWQASWRLIKDNPITGVGFGAYRTAIPMYHDASGSAVPETAINGYLDLLSGGGLIGCMILVWFMAVFLWNCLVKRRPKSSFENAARLGALAGLFGLGVHSLVDNGLNLPLNAIILTVLIVIALVDWQTIRPHGNSPNATAPDSPARGGVPKAHGSNVLFRRAQ